MGEVWLAHDVRVDRDIAIKLMRGGGSTDADAVARFLREARVQGRLEHPSVVPVHDLGGSDDAPYFAMKRLTGTTLAEVIARPSEKWPRRTLLARFVDVCLAVEFAHARGVIHRDLKPANIMLGDYGETYVLDWGLARIDDSEDSGAIRASDLRGDSGVAGHTEAGAMLGTPGYMAPEQINGERVDRRTDVYALGCVLFEILTGAPAAPRAQALALVATLEAACHRPSQRSADIPPELDDACARATAANPDDRFATARELADTVQRFLDGDRDLARRRELAAEHAARAQQLLAGDDIEARAEAMREAGSAIALDAENRDAQAVLARLLLEPPKTMPPAAKRKLEEDRERATSVVLRGVFVIYLFCLVLPPIVKLLGGEDSWWPFLVIEAELVALVVTFAFAIWRRWYIHRSLVAFACIAHIVLLATVGLTFGALLLVPILMFGSLPLMLMSPLLRAPRMIFAIHLLALVVPLTLELVGVVPASFTLTGSALVLDPWAVSLDPTVLLFIIGMVCMLQLVANTVILSQQRAAQDRAQELLHVQSWQLAQLVPAERSMVRT